MIPLSSTIWEHHARCVLSERKSRSGMSSSMILILFPCCSAAHGFVPVAPLISFIYWLYPSVHVWMITTKTQLHIQCESRVTNFWPCCTVPGSAPLPFHCTSALPASSHCQLEGLLHILLSQDVLVCVWYRSTFIYVVAATVAVNNSYRLTKEYVKPLIEL